MADQSVQRAWESIKDAVGAARGPWPMTRRIGSWLVLLLVPSSTNRALPEHWFSINKYAMGLWMVTIVFAFLLSVRAIYEKRVEVERLTDIPEDDRDLIRRCRKIAGEIHDAVSGIKIPVEDSRPELAVKGLRHLDSLSGQIAEYEELHRALTDYKRCVLTLLREWKSTPLAEAERLEALLAPEKDAFRSLLKESARLLGITQPEDPPSTTDN